MFARLSNKIEQPILLARIRNSVVGTEIWLHAKFAITRNDIAKYEYENAIYRLNEFLNVFFS